MVRYSTCTTIEFDSCGIQTPSQLAYPSWLKVLVCYVVSLSPLNQEYIECCNLHAVLNQYIYDFHVAITVATLPIESLQSCD